MKPPRSTEELHHRAQVAYEKRKPRPRAKMMHPWVGHDEVRGAFELYAEHITPNGDRPSGYDTRANTISLLDAEIDRWRSRSNKGEGFRRLVRALARDMLAIEAMNFPGEPRYSVAINSRRGSGPDLDVIYLHKGAKLRLSRLLAR